MLFYMFSSGPRQRVNAGKGLTMQHLQRRCHLAKAQSNANGGDCSICKAIEPQLRILFQRITVVGTTASCAELVLHSESQIGPVGVVTSVVSNIADELGQIGEVVATLIVALGGDPYADPPEDLVRIRPEMALDTAARKGRPGHRR